MRRISLLATVHTTHDGASSSLNSLRNVARKGLKVRAASPQGEFQGSFVSWGVLSSLNQIDSYFAQFKPRPYVAIHPQTHYFDPKPLFGGIFFLITNQNPNIFRQSGTATPGEQSYLITFW
jgi:hypothetical protein